jgi:hypothetical protein
MRASHVPGFVVTACAAMLAGCGALQSVPPPSGIANQQAPPVQAATGRISWTAKGLKQRDLLYVSNANGTVSVYRYWQRTLVGVLTDFSAPRGMCADAAGNVYITDAKAEKVYEYAHGGTKPIRAIDDSPYAPFACSVAASNGDLAIANAPYDYYKPAGNIAIYRHATGKPTILAKGDDFTGCAYDDRGDLLALSEYYYSPFWYFQSFYLPKNSTKLIQMTLPGISYSSHAGVVEAVGWDGKYWAVGPAYNDLFLYTIDVKATMEGTVDLKIGPYAIYPGPLAFYRATKGQATQVVAGAGDTTAYYWKYPAGGDYFAEITEDLDKPFGVAISLGSE